MTTAPTSTWIRLPDHLGDTVLALPALVALAARGPCWVAGPQACRWVADTVVPPPGGPTPRTVDTAVLFKPAFRAVLQGPRCRRRVGLVGDHRWPGLDLAVVPSNHHRQHDLDRVATQAGATPQGAPTLPEAHLGTPAAGVDVLLLPLSATGTTVQWPGFRALADRLHAHGWAVGFAAGPGEDGPLHAIAGPHRRLPALSLADLAATTVAARAVVGNDSGLTHLAVAARRGAQRPTRAVIGITGSTSEHRTGAPGATWLHGARPPCWPCYRATCPHGLACQDLAVDVVLHAVLGALGPGPSP